MRLRKSIGIAAGVLIGAVVGIQFIRPTLPSGPVTGDLNAPAAVKQILRTACYDCHSNETRLPWFDRIVPAYWKVVEDVKQGRRGLNFSELSEAQQKGALWESVNQIRLGAMPPKIYELIHPSSRITPEQLSVLENYLTESAPSVITKTPAASELRLVSMTSPATVRPAPNGIEFQPEYKNWTPINSTERFDNHSMRVILGNDAAVDAIEHGQTNPWPNGTMFAKVAWNQVDDGTGTVRPGEFIQVEFMMKDDRRYASTKGWGFARWKGADLVPYGKTASFTAECVGCHTPMRNNDFVFTTPVRTERPDDSELTSRIGTLPSKVISSSINRRDGTMAILYGNDLAVSHARESTGPYPRGSVLSLVTWSQQPDDHWFGARIPANVRSVEIVSIDSSPAYFEFQGSPLRKVAPSAADARIAYILSQHGSEIP